MRNRSCLFFCIIIFLLSVPSFLFAGSVQLRWQANSESDLQSYNVYYGTKTRNYAPPIPVDNSTSYTLSGLDEGATYFFAVSAVDTSGNESGYSEEIAKTIQFVDNPYQLLWSPNNRSNPTRLDNATISGDGYIFLTPETSVVQVDYSIDGQFHNTERYAPFDIGEPVHTTTINDGTHVIIARVTLENGSTFNFDTTCMVANIQTPAPDTTAPEIRITEPTSADGYMSQTATIDLAGTAGDDQELKQITWISSNGGSGIASGTTNWSISGINLAKGDTVITITASDRAGNTSTDRLTIHYNAQDTEEPTVQIVSPTTQSSFFSRTSKITVSGTAADNSGIEKVVWRNSQGESGICNGTRDWQTDEIPLNRWWNTIAVTAFDYAGNSSEQELRVFRWR